MSNLYNQLAPVYEAMYKSFINYAEEFKLYKSLVEPHIPQKTVAEIGCGTGNLANYFMKAGYEYTGLDISEKMLYMAKQKAPNCKFCTGDMREFSLKQLVDCCIITARTVSYLNTNKEVNQSFKSINNNLKPNGILAFDFIDANKFVNQLKINNTPVHKAIDENVTYVRKGHWECYFKHGIDFKWTAKYYKEDDGKIKHLGTDEVVLRAFTKNEIEIWLAINGFKSLEFIEKETYAYPTFVVVAMKIQ